MGLAVLFFKVLYRVIRLVVELVLVTWFRLVGGLVFGTGLGLLVVVEEGYC